MELRKCVRAFGQIGVPHADRALYTDLAHEQAIHPAKGELHVFDALFLEVRSERC